jgi:hypothetical protein
MLMGWRGPLWGCCLSSELGDWLDESPGWSSSDLGYDEGFIISWRSTTSFNSVDILSLTVLEYGSTGSVCAITSFLDSWLARVLLWFNAGLLLPYYLNDRMVWSELSSCAKLWRNLNCSNLCFFLWNFINFHWSLI